MALDADLQALWDASTPESLNFRSDLLRTQAIRNMPAAVDKGVQGLMDTAGTVREEVVRNIYLTLAPNYMKPTATYSTGMTDAQMSAEAAANGKRLGKAAWQVWQEITGALAGW